MADFYSLDDSLAAVYPDNVGIHVDRYLSAQGAFIAHYGPGSVYAFRAPGRVNLIGEHTDYNHGYVLPIALDRDILLLARPRADEIVQLANVERGFAESTFAISSTIAPESKGHWSNYVRGAAQILAQSASRILTGMDVLIAGAPPYGVPRGSGLSSSSALTVASAVALAYLNHLEFSTAEFARLCSDGEWYVGTRGGIMDQFVGLMARRDHTLFLDCRPSPSGSYTTSHMPLPAGYSLLVVDSGTHHNNVRGEFNQRVAACRTGVAILRQRFPKATHLRDVQDVAWPELAPLLPDQLPVTELEAQGLEIGDLPGLDGDAALRVRACCRHVWSENKRVLATLDALVLQDGSAVGRLLDDAHASARDDYAISTPALEILVDAARRVPGVAGARLTGAGWGGSVIVLVETGAVAQLEGALSSAYVAAMGRAPVTFPRRAGSGAGLVYHFPA